MAFDVSITNEQKVKITASPVTATGRPAPIEGGIVVSVISGEGTVQAVDLEPLSVYLVSGDNPGDTVYLVEADADLGEGVVLIQDTVNLHVAGAQAANLGLSIGVAELK